MIPTDLRQYVCRNIEVELTTELSFQMCEVLAQGRPSHWARIWPSSLVLSRWLLEQARETLPVSGIELGCGMGLCSMTLAHLGVQIESTDREPTALAFVKRTAERNRLTGLTVSYLDWGLPVGPPSAFLLASDLLYEQDAPERLFSLVETAGLLLPHGRLLLAGPRERAWPQDQFVRLAKKSGYQHHEEARWVEWEGRKQQIEVHLLTRPA